MLTDITLDYIFTDSDIFSSREELEDFLSALDPVEQAQFITSLTGGLSEPEQKFVELFPHRYKWLKGIGCPATGTNVDWVHIPGKLDDGILLSNWKNPGTYISVSFGVKTRYLVLDIDADSPYHWVAERIKIEQALEQVAINQVNWYQSSGSEGLHGYIVFPADVSSFGASCIINKCLREAGLDIKDGVLEIYPNMKAWGAGFKTIRLPLQTGFGCTLPQFLEEWVEAEKVNDAALFISLEQEARKWVKTERLVKVREGSTGSASDWCKRLQEVIATGWTDYSQTNEILGRIAQYHRVFDENAVTVQKLAELMSQTAVNCPGYDKYCQHKHQITQRCRDWANACWRRYKPFGTDAPGKGKSRYTKVKEEENKNLLNAESNRQLIISTIQSLKGEGKKISLRSVAQASGLNRATVTKHRDLLAGLLLHSV